MLTDAPTTRLAGPKDHLALTDVLTRAFHDDPIMQWVLPNPAVLRRRAPAFFAWSLQRHLPQRASWTTPTAAGAALWAQPGQWRERPREALQLVLRMAGGVGRRAPLVLRGLGQIERLHPATPHLYLAVLGVDPSRQGQGVGSSLLAPGLHRCDTERLPAYLETGKARNVPFYERHGFEVTGELTLPQGPTVWTMWRDPR